MIQSRVRGLNTKNIGTGPVVYWMDRDMRTQDNWALIHASEIAIKKKVPLIVVYNLVTSFLGGGARQLYFKVDALQEIQNKLQKKHIPFFVLIDEVGKKSAYDIVEFCSVQNASCIVTDFSPLRIQREWKEYVAKHAPCAMYEVDAHNIIPVWVTSQKQEYAAYTIRPKIHRLVNEYMDEFPISKVHSYMYVGKDPEIDWNTILKKVKTKSEKIIWCNAGEKAANKTLDFFLNTKLEKYADVRNDANVDGQSDLSPYLHYGMISAQRIALDVIKKVGVPITDILHASKNKASVDIEKELKLIDHSGAFLEELIVRRELSDNFCLYNAQYDSVLGFPEWSQKNYKAHTLDKREYVYTKKQFENADTHDDLWNAAQSEMVLHGKMHGYMRMYWAKKILEWTPDVETAMKVAIYLNDTYELDGRDPNGYAGIAWSIGGTHDRTWFTRNVFGTVRFMARSGCEKKFDVKAYIAKWSGKNRQQILL